jgi:hypothetical protein
MITGMTDPQPDAPTGDQVTPSDAVTSPSDASQEGNPFVGALAALGSLALAVGVILVIVGVANGASYDPGEFSGHNDSGLGELALGNLFCTVGGLVLIAGLIIAGVDWSIRHYASGRTTETGRHPEG